MAGLSVRRLINVTVNLGPRAAQQLNFDTLCIIGSTDVINTYERIRSYNGIDEVGFDFSTTDPEYIAASEYFDQSPKPTQVYIGRWAETRTSAELVGSGLTANEQLLSNWTSITDGSFTVSIDGVVTNVLGLDFSAATNLNDVAEIISAKLEDVAATVAAVAAPGGNGVNHSYAPADTITLAGGETQDPAVLNVTHTQVIDVQVAVGGTGGTPGAAVITGTTGTGTKFTANAVISPSGALTSITSIVLHGDYTVNPSNLSQEPITGGSLSGAKVLVRMGVLNATINHAGEYGEVPPNPVAQDITSGNGRNATFNMTWNGSVAALCTWTGTHFIIESSSKGAASMLSYLTPAVIGTDISALLKMTAATAAYPPVQGMQAESALQCIVILTNLTTFSYGYMFASTDLSDDDNLSVAEYIEATSNPHVYGITTDDAGAIDPQSTSDIGYLLKQQDLQRTVTQYSSTTDYAIASFFGRAFTTDLNETNSAIILMYKQEPGVVPEILTATAADSLDAKNYTYYATFDNGTNIIVNGIMASGIFFDDIYNADWYANRIQTDLFNRLYTTPTKIPQTDQGTQTLVNTVNGSSNAALTNGILGPNVWRYDGFGSLKTGDYLSTGYYVYGNPIATQSLADRQRRLAPPIQVAAMFAGGVQGVNVTVNVQR